MDDLSKRASRAQEHWMFLALFRRRFATYIRYLRGSPTGLVSSVIAVLSTILPWVKIGFSAPLVILSLCFKRCSLSNRQVTLAYRLRLTISTASNFAPYQDSLLIQLRSWAI